MVQKDLAGGADGDDGAGSAVADDAVGGGEAGEIVIVESADDGEELVGRLGLGNEHFFRTHGEERTVVVDVADDEGQNTLRAFLRTAIVASRDADVDEVLGLAIKGSSQDEESFPKLEVVFAHEEIECDFSGGSEVGIRSGEISQGDGGWEVFAEND